MYSLLSFEVIEHISLHKKNHILTLCTTVTKKNKYGINNFFKNHCNECPKNTTVKFLCLVLRLGFRNIELKTSKPMCFIGTI